ncbi:DUF4129 domain-containing protein [Jiella avicenniae]|uniref:DUF4129 domain-containing protein n=1 Tax=Jiella avicenniae TaxID=2907202 RepID=A0A9X1P2Z8_9HYPH|nr:DUF4129 domain-containing protein [Jiella avicenniae]MCE7029281.1 DUF4129 domain-containing protein [Jiella avicenniae]
MPRLHLLAVPLAAVALVVLGAGGEASGQTRPPAERSAASGPSEAGKAYLESVERMRLQSEIQYLSPDGSLDEAPAAEEALPDIRPSAPLEWGATTLLVVCGLFLAVLLWLGRGQLADLKGPRNRKLAHGSPAAAGGPERPDLDRDLIARLRQERDPRSGLRQVLERFLKLAAEDNAIVLKRSLTTRELMQRLPGSWAHRGELEVLAENTELVLFGGRDIGAAEYQRCLDLAEPFLRRTRR